MSGATMIMMMMMTRDKQRSRSACRSAGMKVVSGPETTATTTDNPGYKRFDRQRHTLHSNDNFPAERLKGKSFSRRNRQQQIRQRLRPGHTKLVRGNHGTNQAARSQRSSDWRQNKFSVTIATADDGTRSPDSGKVRGLENVRTYASGEAV